MNSNISNIVAVNRTVKCDFYRDLAIDSVFNGGELDEGDIKYDIKYDNNDTLSNNICNHETLINLNHSNNEEYKWICKEFIVTKKDFEENNYYLFFGDQSIKQNNYWILDNFRNISTFEKPINIEKISLKDNFSDIFEKENSTIFYLHFKVNKNKLNNFKVVLVGIPKDMEDDNLNIDYFKEQECYLVMKTCYSS